MNKFKVLVTGRGTLLATFESYEEARNIAIKEAKSTGKETCVLEVISTHSPVIDSYEAAKTYLGEDAKNHQKALSAMGQLIVIAEAWNKADNFVPDYDNTNQYKWYPWFRYDNESAGFVYDESFSDSGVGSRLCFKSLERAEQFGKQFINLWNDFLLFR